MFLQCYLYFVSQCCFFCWQDNAEKQAQIDRIVREKRSVESELEKVCTLNWNIKLNYSVVAIYLVENWVLIQF